jgi:uncharacterized protein YigA (DUF484 family)
LSTSKTPRRGASAGVPGDEEGDAVERYLRAHPDFLQRRPDLLGSLHLDHECGGAVSLIEHQVQSLRRQVSELQDRLAALVENARGNEELAQRLHRLVLALVESPGLDEIFTTLYQGLEESFGADRVALRVFAYPRSEEDRGLAELVGPDDAGRALFGALLESCQPVCGPPDDTQARWLFAERAAEVGSMALIPLSLGERRGVLAIASASATRFQPTMGTLYLRQLAGVLGRLILAWTR